MNYTYKGGEPGTSVLGKVCVAMCIWKRPVGVATVLKVLSEETYGGEVVVRIWNNCKELAGFYDKVVELTVGKKFADVDVVHSDSNMYTHPRFAMAAMTDAQYVVTLDDDVVTKPHLLQVFVEEIEKRGVACGGYGRVLERGRKYWKSGGGNFRSGKNIFVNCLGPGAAIYRREWLCAPVFYSYTDVFFKCDDIWSSYALHAQGVKRFRFDTRKVVIVNEVAKVKRRKAVVRWLNENGLSPDDIPEDCKKGDVESIADQPGVYEAKNEAVEMLHQIDPSFFDPKVYGDERDSAD